MPAAVALIVGLAAGIAHLKHEADNRRVEKFDFADPHWANRMTDKFLSQQRAWQAILRNFKIIKYELMVTQLISEISISY